MNRKDETTVHDHVRSKVPIVLDACEPDPTRWKNIKSKHDVQVWEEIASHDADSYTIRSCVTVDASLEELLQVLECSKSNAYRSFMRVTYGSAFADAAVLYHRELNSQESMAIKWLAYRCNSRLVLDLDLCLVEYSNLCDRRYADPLDNQSEETNQESWACTPLAYKVFESINTKHCPSMIETHKLERGYFDYSAYVFYPTRHTDQTRVMFLASIHQPPPQIRRRANKALLQNIAINVTRLQNAVDAYRISSKLSQRRINWISDADRQACAVCIRSFNHIRRKHHCRLCGEVICRHCSVYKDAELPLHGLTLLRICRTCDEISKPRPLPPAEPSNTQGRSSINLKSVRSSGELLNRNKLESLVKSCKKKTSNRASFKFNFEFSTRSSINAFDLKQAARPVNRIGNSDIIQKNNTLTNTVLLETPFTDIFRVLCELATESLNCRYAAVSLIDVEQDYLKSTSCERLLKAPKNLQCCAPIIAAKKPVLVTDTQQQPSWSSLPIVRGPHKARFYAGAPLKSSDGQMFGAVCVFDAEPRSGVEDREVKIMEGLANLAVCSMKERQKRLESLRANAFSEGLDNFLPDDTRDTPEIRMMNLLFKASQTQQQVKELKVQHRRISS